MSKEPKLTKSQIRRRIKKIKRYFEEAENKQLGNRRYAITDLRPGTQSTLNKLVDQLRAMM